MAITARGITKVSAKLSGMAQRVADLSPAMQAGAQAFIKFVSDRFRSQTDPEGVPWRPLAASTIAGRRKGRGRGGARILEDSGILKNSITAVAGKRSITYGTNVPYAGFHQFGTRKIPKRAFLPVSGRMAASAQGGPSAALYARVTKYIANYVMRGRP